MLRRRGGPDELDKGLTVIEQSVQAQAALIDDLLVASRMASDRIRLDAVPLDLAAVVDAAVESARPAFADKQIEVRQVFEPVGAMKGDPTRLRQVLGKLLANAAKFTPQGGHVEVAMRPSRGFAVVSVSDDGAGIAPARLPQVFDRWRDPAAAREHGGLGLGLAIARHLVELHGGEIEATSEGEGRGATFAVRLPLAD
jgi:signal transduction histidine kinase